MRPPTLSNIPSAKKWWSSSVGGPGLVADGPMEPGELLAHGGPDLVVAAGGVGLQLDAQEIAIAEEIHVGEAHAPEDVAAAPPPLEPARAASMKRDGSARSRGGRSR